MATQRHEECRLGSLPSASSLHVGLPTQLAISACRSLLVPIATGELGIQCATANATRFRDSGALAHRRLHSHHRPRSNLRLARSERVCLSPARQRPAGGGYQDPAAGIAGRAEHRRRHRGALPHLQLGRRPRSARLRARGVPRRRHSGSRADPRCSSLGPWRRAGLHAAGRPVPRTRPTLRLERRRDLEHCPRRRSARRPLRLGARLPLRSRGRADCR